MKRILFITMMAVATMAATAQEITVNTTSNKGIIVTTNTKYATRHLETIKKCCPKTYFEALANDLLRTGITNFYFFDKLPQDTIEVIDAPNTVMTDSYRKRFASVDFEQYDKERIASLSQNPEFVKMSRGEFWNEIFKIHRKYANSDGFALIESHIKEVQAALGQKEEECIFVSKDAFKKEEDIVKYIFTHSRNEVNPVYLRN